MRATSDPLLLTAGELGRAVGEPILERTVETTVSSHLAGFLRASDIGSVMFTALNVDEVGAWKTKPILSRG